LAWGGFLLALPLPLSFGVIAVLFVLFLLVGLGLGLVLEEIWIDDYTGVVSAGQSFRGCRR
jgi:hypothetical protein